MDEDLPLLYFFGCEFDEFGWWNAIARYGKTTM